MSVFSNRTKGYKYGVLLLIFASSVFFVGFVAPYWKTLRSTDHSLGTKSFDEGLWMYCVSEDYYGVETSSCVYGDTKVRERWFQGVRALEAFSFVGLLLSSMYAVRINCCRFVVSPRNRILEAMTALSGVIGITGCTVYVAYLSSGKHGHMIVHKDANYVVSSGLYATYFYWGFYMTAVASALSVVAAIIIFIFNREVPVAASPPIVGCGEGSNAGNVMVILALTTVPLECQGQGQGYDAQQQQQPGYGYSYGYGYPSTFEPAGGGLLTP